MSPFTKRYRVRKVFEYIIEAQNEFEALERYYMDPLPKVAAVEVRIRTEEAS